MQWLCEVVELLPEARQTIYETSSTGQSCWSAVRGNLTSTLDSFSAKITREVATFQTIKPGNGWTEANRKQRSNYLFSDLQLCVWAAQALSVLAERSLKEDRQAVVQRSLTQIFRSLLDAMIAVETYSKSAAWIDPKDRVRLGQKFLLRPQTYIACKNLENALYRLVTVFYSQLQEFPLPPRHADRLEAFVNFSN
mmetsp:Transcript_31246/g.60904  ORF Transcript_31246/g.60904 Transcript_31246/m.60904 type:complete len:195 (+) Transcript_31246:337-921(+)|eukprot:CAMPEP_0175126464 /NCGR_PEP_ID=MMETSP0087-20121206/3870_1 /TAXON_ID=136419 /ORGANISM="Unknown Unknown, Strain D1" /LENGTH=194 /DNA_ID=CAMNT_0016408383 /DNA_START=1154 /DNA_END=1738 /DNA_ORIENTATION=-